jgi:hypothetical protein
VITYIVAIFFIGKGLVNLSGVLAPWTKNMQGFKDASWIFSKGITLTSTLGKAFSIVWLASTTCLVAAGIGILSDSNWWVLLAIAGCICSLLAAIVWWKAVVPGARVGAIIDGVVIVILTTPLGNGIIQAVG